MSKKQHEVSTTHFAETHCLGEEERFIISKQIFFIFFIYSFAAYSVWVTPLPMSLIFKQITGRVKRGCLSAVRVRR
jgi:hypothetical protein